ncbi:hypothetical protein [Halorubrum trueperi]|uniref:Uncharacterized protein n=1 Tax=Halorubrum trueperi TaxID=2004704 RepID=A0ABD5ULB2_9EURY
MRLQNCLISSNDIVLIEILYSGMRYKSFAQEISLYRIRRREKAAGDGILGEAAKRDDRRETNKKKDRLGR